MGLTNQNKKVGGQHKRNKTHAVFSEETLKIELDEEAKVNQELFLQSGFPPKICAELVNKMTPEK